MLRPDRRALRRALALLVLLPCAASAQVAAPDDPRVDSIFAAWDRPGSPGCALGVYRDGEMVYGRGYGMADLEHGVPIMPHTVFDIGSTSKQFAAASILLLAQQGRLTLDDDVRRHVPELPAYSRPITIRQLLHHTSGLRDYIGLLTLSGKRIDDVTTPEDALAILARQQQLNFEPGTEHLYSNSGYFLLSLIVERASGSSLRDFARTHIFTPLGMERTHYLGSYSDIVPDRAIGYSLRDGALHSDVPRWLQLGDGAVWTTVEELQRWDENFYHGQVGGPELLAALQTPGTLADGAALSYALGLMVGEHRGQRTVSHGGSWGGYRAELLRFPDQHFSVATLCNLSSIDPSRLALQVADVLLADVLAPAPAPAVATAAPATVRPEPAPVSVPETTLRGLAGAWRDTTTRATVFIAFEAGRLYVTSPGRYDLRPVSASEYELIGPPVRVALSFEPAEGARRLRLAAEGREPQWYVRQEPVTLGEADLPAFAGTFTSAELQVTWTIAVQDGALVLHATRGEERVLRPVVRDEFAAGSWTVRFQRRDDGGITGFQLDVGRARGIGFERASSPPSLPAR